MNPYVDLLRRNRNFRLLFVGQAVSQLGDWFNSVAVLALLLDLTGSATAVAWMMIVQFLPVAFIGPLAGVVVDRVDRRKVMIAADVMRGVLVLGLLAIRRADQVWMAYAVMSLTVAASAFFEPARTATIPNVTSADELLPANALSSATWSAMLAIGASVGGIVTALAGRDVAFVLNALSFFASAACLARTTYDSTPEPKAGPAGLAAFTGEADLAEGFRYVRGHARVAALIFVKTGWSLAGGVLLLLSVFGQRVFPIGGNTAAGIGVLYSARGVGAGLGPVALRWILGQDPKTLRRSIGPAFLFAGASYMALGGAPNLAWASLAVMCAHFGGSILWVFSTVLLQMEVPNELRGRVFAVELASMTLMLSISSYWTGYALEYGGTTPRAAAVLLGAAFAAPGALWFLVERRWQEAPPSAAPNPAPSGEEESVEGRIG